MVGRVEMPGGVLILRIVAATDMSTGETEAQVHPGITRFQTVLTSIGARRNLAYLVEVATLLCHMILFSFLDTPGRSLIGVCQSGLEHQLICTATPEDPDIRETRAILSHSQPAQADEMAA